MDTTLWIIIFSCLFVFSLIAYNFKKIKSFFSKLFKSSNNKKTKSSNKKSAKSKAIKLKATENQIRPLLKAPEEKPTNTKDKEEKTKVEEQKAMDYKFKPVSPVKEEKKNLDDLKLELDKEFEEIRKYLDFPKSNNIKDVYSKRINPNLNINAKQNINSNTFLNNSNKQGFYDAETQSLDTMMDIEKKMRNNRKPALLNSPKSEYENELRKRSIYHKDSSLKTLENKVMIDGEEIDLNKLPLNIKKLLISNILSKKNYD
ncbi:MAG: hypothetical protein IJD48_01730 [Clostridia bacterium]|nr:hypothetical protein [Clostridia bacterium]